MNTERKCRGTLLVVDDMPANLSVLTSFLHNAGFTMLTATSGKGALR
ncbi:MAG: response regulator, partial [Gammaproteobacteria bacterium]|nr:response regulator [Gammaproteobacteria bacterium]